MERASVPRGKRPRVQVSVDDKERAIARIRKGETKAGISRELGVPESTVRGWVKRSDQRLAREACEIIETPSPSSLQPQPLKIPMKRDYNGQQILPPMAPIPTIPTNPTLPVVVPVPMQLFQQAADSQLQLNGWLHIFNAGILNFTLIASAAYSRARMRGTTDHQSLWQIICEYVDEAGRNVAANGGQYVTPTRETGQMDVNRQLNSPAPSHSNGFVRPRLHITAEDDEEAMM